MAVHDLIGRQRVATSSTECNTNVGETSRWLGRVSALSQPADRSARPLREALAAPTGAAGIGVGDRKAGLIETIFVVERGALQQLS